MSSSVTIYRIWRHGWITSGGFHEYYDEPDERFSGFLSKENAKASLPKDVNEPGVCWEYYIKEEVIND